MPEMLAVGTGQQGMDTAISKNYAAIGAILLLILSTGGAQGKEPDGCSGGMSAYYRNVLGSPPVWEHCCFKHDLAYAKPFSSTDRARADRDLELCVSRTGYPDMAVIMGTAVRLGGGIHYRVSPKSDDPGDIRWRQFGGPE